MNSSSGRTKSAAHTLCTPDAVVVRVELVNVTGVPPLLRNTITLFRPLLTTTTSVRPSLSKSCRNSPDVYTPKAVLE